ncbi:hypothetical protein [Lutibacter sp.]|jgi:hypothetical protein|uniref:hypothetical protein n=1 Tax=Lutibacter sp. TaxID=1925666 RepID=UPI001A1AAFC6|nr:hypothetical protein [Lutibacter sp.]MBI9042510.1 hypothetical protein [Lutibacter sp.]
MLVNKKLLVIVILVSLISIQCSKKNNFTIEKGKVGVITKETQIKDLSVIFKNDSIVSKLFDSVANSRENLFSNEDDEYIIYSKNGDKLLEISPEKLNDETSTIKSIQIFNSNYKTEKGISLKSTFKEINEHYLINKVESTLTSATLFIDELNATISIDKKDLGLNGFSREEISVEQIPDNAKVKYFTIWFN